MASQHTHISAVNLGTAFAGVLLMGTLWRLLAAHLATSGDPRLVRIGQVMAFQY